MLLDIATSVACLVLMLAGLPVATLLGNRGMWGHRLSLFATELGLCLVAINPWTLLSPPVPWTCSFVFIAAAFMVGIFWRVAWNFIVSQYTPQHSPRRITDLKPAEHLHVSGGCRK